MADEARAPDSAPLGRVLVSGGGSGGHVFPALAVGDELARRGWRVSFAGDPRGMEARLVAGRGLEFVSLPARPVVGRGPLARVAAVATLLRSALRARAWLRRQRVDAVVATGGYASAPAALGASWAGRPLLLVEPNARAGAANRWLSRRASAAALGDPAAAVDLRCPSFVAGVPVRAELFRVPPLEPTAPPRLLVLGGSQGSRRINELVASAGATLLRELPALSVLHQCGDRWPEETAHRWRESAPDAAERVEVRPFVSDVAGALGSASLVVSRAGAITLAELCAAGRPSVLLPLSLAGAHQRDNARTLEAIGAADVLEPESATADDLARILLRRLGDPAALAEAGRRAHTLARPGAAEAIADRVEELARRRAA